MTRTAESVAAKWREEIDAYASHKSRAEMAQSRAVLLGKELIHHLADRLPPFPSEREIAAIDWTVWEYPELPLTLPSGERVIVWLFIDELMGGWGIASIVDAPEQGAAS